jgi:hypothetical protein
VKPQAGAFLAKSRELLARAETMLGVGLNADAGRTAYPAGLHAAQALIFETTGHVFKRHVKVQGDPRVEADLRAFLGRTYNLKAIAITKPAPVQRSPQRVRVTLFRPRAGSSNVSRACSRPTVTHRPQRGITNNFLPNEQDCLRTAQSFVDAVGVGLTAVSPLLD